METLTFEDVITTGSRSIKGKTVREIIEKDKHLIFEMIKKYHFNFSNEVLAEAGINKVEGKHSIHQEEISIPRDTDATKSRKKVKKDTKDIETILDELTDKYGSVKLIDDNDEGNTEESDTVNEYKEVENSLEYSITQEDPEV